MKNSVTVLLECTASLFLGIVLTFAFAPYEIFPLAVLAPAGLLALWIKASPSTKYTFWLGYLFGLGFFGAGVYWVFISINTFGGVPTPLALVITFGMIGLLAFYPALTGYFLNRYFPQNYTAKLLCAFPAIWVIGEWVRSWLFTGFPWLFLGYSQTNSPLKGYAPLLSVYGVSLALTLSSALIVNAVIQYRQKQYRKLYFQLLGLALIWIIGSLVSHIPWTRTEGKPLSVALVQGNIPQSLKWSPDHVQLSFDRYTDLTKPLWGKTDLIIWPEAAIPMTLQNSADFIDKMNEQAKTSGSALILGIPVETTDRTGFQNAVVALGKQNSAYVKRHLVPFGEYIPFNNIFSKTFQFMNIPVPEMKAGNINQKPLRVNDLNILPSICYEITFPDLTRNIDKNINLILVVTNDAWFGNSNAEPQHLQMAAMRALEFHKPVLFVSNDGITAVINPDGQITDSVPQFTTTVLKTTVQPMYGITPWLTNGTDPVFLIIFYFLFYSYREKKLHQMNAQKTSTPNKAKKGVNTTNLNVSV